jgi:hypothetical protein
VLSSAAAFACASNEDSGFWAGATVSKRFSERMSAALAAELRFNNDIGTLERTLLRPSVSYHPDGRQVLSLGYDAHVIESPRDRLEQRVWQQYQVSEPIAHLLGTFRFRLEERMIEDADETAVRARIKGQLKVPLAQTLWYFIVSEEVFLGFNEVTGRQRDGYDENRAFAGFGHPLAPGVVGQLGYQNQHVNARGADRMTHQILVSFTIDLP